MACSLPAEMASTMRQFQTIVLVLAMVATAALPMWGQSPVRIIFDTDMDTDCDDAGAPALLHALADQGEETCETFSPLTAIPTARCVGASWSAAR